MTSSPSAGNGGQENKSASTTNPIDGDALIHWAHTTLLPLIERPLRAGVTWCPRWWEHVEATWRIEAIRRAWTKAVVSEDPQAMSDWAIYVVDAHMAQLLSPTGPFADCGYSDRHGFQQLHQPRSLPVLDPDDLDRNRFPHHIHRTEATANSGTPPEPPSGGGGSRQPRIPHAAHPVKGGDNAATTSQHGREHGGRR